MIQKQVRTTCRSGPITRSSWLREIEVDDGGGEDGATLEQGSSVAAEQALFRSASPSSYSFSVCSALDMEQVKLPSDI